ncbi:erythromycin esterase family protein [Nonomuraea longicatena]|uniref:Erythromycin esterase family protein n=1 Tax=Nonomuraea longicatena TaxID=83682 RepID=A0ABN1PL74_9ACTN
MTDEVVAWLAERAVPLRDLTPGRGTADLAPFGAALDGVRVAGLGEATHGSREFFLLKHRLLEYLVEELGFTVVAMEASEAAAMAIDAYVRGAPGDAAALVEGLGFWTWSTAEVLDVVEWLRRHNATARRKVRFIGFDPQHPGASLDALRTELGDDPLLAPLAPLATARIGGAPLDPQVVADAVRLEAALAAGGSQAARAHARILRQLADLATRPYAHTDAERTLAFARDRHMADNITALLDDPAAKVAVWAHNGHIAKSTVGSTPIPSMGSYLADRFGPAYYALGLLFAQGEFRARRTRFGRVDAARPPVTFTVPRADNATTVEARLFRACPDDHLADLRGGPRPAAVEAWLRERLHLRVFGAAASRFTHKFTFGTGVLADDYDGLALVTRTTASVPLP